MLLRIALLSALAAAPLAGQTASFDLMSGGRNVGRASYTLSKAKQGYKLSSRLSYHLNGVESDITDEFKYTDAYAYTEGSSSSISTQMHTSFTPNKARTEMVVGMVQGGVQDSRHLVIKPDFAVMPPYDPGAAQAMLLLATTHPTEKNLYNIVVPGAAGPAPTPPPESGEAPVSRTPPGNNAYDALWTKGPDVAGTLDGKPVPVHSFVLTSGKFTWTFFADDANNLLQLDNSMAHVSYVRAKFKLDLPAGAMPQ